MKCPARTIIKKALSKILPDSIRLRYLAYRPRFETWLVTHTKNYPPMFKERNKMYDFLNREIISNKPIDYLEFGVFKGMSIKYWAGINSDSHSRFVGFDTFTGLPENWDHFSYTVKEKTFDVAGALPQIDDTRVSFVKGLFQDTLPKFLEEYEPTNPLVIHNDSDLYSSTLYVLTYANDIIVPGTIIIFDEFYGILHEFRALEDYCVSYMRSYEVITATQDYEQIAIKIK